MFEKITESTSIESKETLVKSMAREMLRKFRRIFKRGQKLDHSSKDIVIPTNSFMAPEEVETEEIPEPFITPTDIKVAIPRDESVLEESEIEIAEPLISENEKKQIMVHYESVVTSNYFENWDDLDLAGNKGIKDKIKENIVRTEAMEYGSYEGCARDLRISVEEFKSRLQKKVEDIVDASEFFSATKIDVLDKILNVDGRWKSQFETRTSNGTLDPSYRAKAEINMFGFNKNEDINTSDEYGSGLPVIAVEKDIEKRPIYGYFSDDKDGIINYNAKIPPPTVVHNYGTINVKIKKERALKKATVTFHDSLSTNRNWPPTPAAKPHFTSFRMSYHGSSILDDLAHSSMTNWGENYTEVQYHDQLTVDDIESIHISTNNDLSRADIMDIHKIFTKYKKEHPESTIKIIEF